jgi:hypothetical protein
MKRSQVHVGEHLAHVISEYGTIRTTEVVVLSADAWVEAAFRGDRGEIEHDGVTYSLRGYRRASGSDGRQGVLVAVPGNRYAKVVQLRNLEHLATALRAQAGREADAKAANDARAQARRDYYARVAAVREALGLARREDDSIHSDVASLVELESLAARLAPKPV